MAVWSKVQGSPKSWSKLKRVCLNCIIQSAVRMCHTECRYEWRLPGYLGDIFLQGVHFSSSESFCDLEPARWECNSVQLLHCWILNKCVCVFVCIQPEYRPTWTREEQRNPEQKISVLANPLHHLGGGHQCPWQKGGPLTLTAWHPHQLSGYRGLWGGWNSLGEGQGRWRVEVVGRDYWWRTSTGGIETAESEYSHSQWKQDWNLSSVPGCWVEDCVGA